MQNYNFFGYERKDGKIFAAHSDGCVKISEASFLTYCSGRGLLNYDVVEVLSCAGRPVKGVTAGQRPFDDPGEYWDGYDESTILMHLADYVEDLPELTEEVGREPHKPVLLPEAPTRESVMNVFDDLLSQIKGGFRV